jgi:uncharacterized membrane protein YfcA
MASSSRQRIRGDSPRQSEYEGKSDTQNSRHINHLSFFIFALIVGVAFLTEAVVGFGASILPLALGMHLLPPDEILPLIQPVNWLLSGYFALRDIRSLDVFFLTRRVLPWMGVFFFVGFALSGAISGDLLKILFGVFVVVLSSIQLWRSTQNPVQTPLKPYVEAAWLSLAGIIHGIYASGGPMVVYCASRRIQDKTAMRATLSFIWFSFSTALIIGYIARGQVNTTSIQQSAWLLIPLFLGGRIGDIAHHKLPAEKFRVLVYLLLLLAAAFLVLFTLLK